MSSGGQSSLIQSVGLSNNSGLCVIHPENAVLKPPEVRGLSSPLTFNSLTLDTLCKELDRRTKETLKLQEEVENATKVTLEKFGHVYVHNSSAKQGGAPGDSNHYQVVTQVLDCDLDSLHQETTRTNVCSPENEGLPYAVDDCLQRLSEVSDQHEQETYRFGEAILQLQTELQKVQMEKDILSDLRLKDSREHAHQMEKMLCLLEELQVTRRSGEQRLQKTEDEALVLNKKVETLETILKDYYAQFSREKQCEHNPVNSQNTGTTQRHLSTSAVYHNNEGGEIHKKNILEKEHLVEEECIGLNKQEQMEKLIASLGQELASLTEKLSSTKTSSVDLRAKLELLKKIAERQTILHEDQVSELETAISSQNDKVGFLEQQLIHVQSQLVDAKREEERLQNHIQELQSQVSQMMKCGKQEQCELQEEVKALRGQLEVAQEQLCRTGEEKTYLQALLEEREQEGRKSKELLENKKVELQLRQQETQQHVACLDEARSQCHTLHAERETLRMQLNDGEKMIEILRLQLESSSQMTAQHGCTIDTLHQENSFLSNQLNQHKLEILQLRAEIDHQKSALATAEHDRRQLQVSVAEQSHRIQEETLEKQQLTTQLEVQRLQLLTFTKEHKDLQRLQSCKENEHKGVVLKLQSHLKNLQNELDQVRSTLRTLVGADEHGFQIALGMQKEITARREQIDSLQGRIQHLEEMTDRLSQEKLYQKLEHQHQFNELTSLREEKKQLSTALEALYSKDKQLKQKISELEAILHKMSESFASCQDFIQMQEQEFYRLKLKHTLDLKERQGQTLYTSPALVSPSAHTVPPFLQHASDPPIKSKTQEHNPAMEYRSLVKDLQGVISENQRPHTNNIRNATTDSSNIHRRRSAPERARRAALCTGKSEGEVMTGSKLRRKTYGSETQLLKTTDMNGKPSQNNSLSQNPLTSTPTGAAWYLTSSQLLSMGRRSPVHSLLTSDPNC